MKVMLGPATPHAGVLVAGFTSLVALRVLLGGSPAGLVLDVVLAVAGVGATLDAARRARPGRSRRGWRFQTASSLAWLLAPLAWLLALPAAVAVVGRLAFVVLAGGAWWLTSLGSDRWSRVRLVVDSGLAAASGLVVGWVPVLSTVWDRHEDPLLGVAAVALPLGALAVAVMATELAWTEIHPSRRAMPACFVLALLTVAASDVVHSLGGPPFWAVGFGFVVLADVAYAGTSTRQEVISTRHSLVHAPYLLLAPAVVVLVVRQTGGGIAPVEGAAAAVMALLLLLRQHVTLAENHRLVERLAVTERRLRHQATHDALTGLAGRVVLYERLESELARRPHPPTLAVVFLDLDDFKEVNDTHGHAAGDDVLVETARRLRAVVAPLGQDATAVRMSGDEFAVLLVGAAAADAAGTAHLVLESVRRPITVNESTVVVGGSIGVAVADGLAEASALLRAADVAMYAVKHDGKGGVEVASTESNRTGR